MENLWDLIKKTRESAGMTQKEFAQHINCSEQHISCIERPYDETRRTASEKLLRKIAEKFSKTEDERLKLERDLAIARAKLLISKEIHSPTLAMEVLSDAIKESMPREFIERVKHDIQKLEGVSKEPVENMHLSELTEGNIVLSRPSVINLAKRLKQPADDYLMLANYMTEDMKTAMQMTEAKELLEVLSKLTKGQVRNVSRAFKAFVKSYIKEED
jgi:transcriptional regulator with XRE-family HTH domain